MNKKITVLSILTLSLLTNACSSNDGYVQSVLSNSAGVSYEYNEKSLKEMGHLATLHCSGEGKRATMGNTSSLENGNSLVSFKCE